MPAAIEIAKDFPKKRERAVLLELLRLVQELQRQGIDAIVCGGWVPFLKELARQNQTAHAMSLDIDILLRAAAREREKIDTLRYLLRETLGYERTRDVSFRYEKKVDGNLVEVELLADLPRGANDEAVIKVRGNSTSLDVCLADGADVLGEHIETVQITWREADAEQTVEIRIPDAVGFLILKTTVGHYRMKDKDPYDIYYYCRYSEDPDIIRQKLAESKQERAVQSTLADLRFRFDHIDSQWVEMVLNHMNAVGDERDREAQFIVRTIRSITDGFETQAKQGIAEMSKTEGSPS
jgi:hypothetical protein